MKKRPIFQKILFPLIILLLIETFILICGIAGSGILARIEENEKAIVEKTVDNRKTFLENQMADGWMSLSYAVEGINSLVQEYIDTNNLDIATLDDSSSNAAPVLQQLYGKLISVMRSARVTGAFVILNTDDLSESVETGCFEDAPGLYLKDSDPSEQGSTKNADLLVRCAPISVLQKMGIPSDSFWDVEFSFSDYEGSNMDFFYKPFQLAYENPGKYSWTDMGYWSAPFRMFDKDRTMITYSVPLILEDETVYGVLGIDISIDYLQKFLPYTEMSQSGNGAYFLAKKGDAEGSYKEIIGDGNLVGQTSYSGSDIVLDERENFYYESELSLYNNYAPFSEDEWVLVGVVPQRFLLAFVKRIEVLAAAALLITLLLSLAGSIFISYLIQRPIARLSKEVKAQDNAKVIRLRDTGIKEIDQITDELEILSRDAFESSKKFTKIIEMASVRMAGFQIDMKNDKLFVTENFFELLGITDVHIAELTVEAFSGMMENLRKCCVERDYQENYFVFQIQAEPPCFVSLKSRMDSEKNVCFGLVEDVTEALLEKKKIEYDRDHDPLTNLYNRRAFLRKMESLFENQRELIKTGAYVMLDLDNLKDINDTYGHKYGDEYIRRAADILRRSFPKNAIFARISGDEFNVFLYGYDHKKQIEELLIDLKANIKSTSLELPGAEKHKISASGGVAWYPDDSMSFSELAQYADSAMYLVKKNKKGDIAFFHKENDTEYEKK